MRNQYQEMQQDQAPVHLSEQLLAENTQMKQRLWVDSNLAKFDDILRSNYDQPLEVFADVVILQLAKLTHALKGTFFNFNPQNQLIEAVAGYACLPQDKKYRLGEEMVGQAVKSKETIVWDNLNSNSLRLEASTGTIAGSCLVVIPLMFNDNVYGAIELMYLNNLEESYLELLERLGRNVATMLNSIQNNLKTQKLLEEAKALEVELLSREEELRQNMEELGATQEQLEKQLKETAKSHQVTSSILETAIDVIITMNQRGIIQSVNPAIRSLLGYEPEEVIGKNIKVLMPHKYAHQHDGYLKKYKETQQRKVIGIGRKIEVRHKEGHVFDAYLSVSETIIDGEVLFTGFIRDIKELIATQKEVQKKEQALTNQVNAINQTISSIEFDVHGNILDANQLFLDLMEYSLKEIQNKHHQMFMAEGEANTPEYQSFWENLRQGRSQSAEFKRITKNKREVWLRATYTPIKNSEGNFFKVIKLAMDVTPQKKLRQDLTNQMKAIGRSTGVVEYDLQGNILNANPLFLNTMGYSLEEIKGRHHQIFMDIHEAESKDYKTFWHQLKVGKHVEGEFNLIDKTGDQKWLKGSYNPVMGMDDMPYKVIQYATDITSRKLLELENEFQLEEVRAIEEELRQNMEELMATQENLKQKEEALSGRVEAINSTISSIEFDMEGKILQVNQLLLDLMGYTSEEVIGKHHRMFVDKGYAQSKKYAQFWQDLRNNISHNAEFKQQANNDKEVWLRATYTPIKNSEGEPYKVIMLAMDVTEEKNLRVDLGNQLAAIDRSMAVVEFDLEGQVINANQQFLKLMGYQKEEIINKHHQIFVSAQDTHTLEYQQFWHQLKNGNAIEGEFMRIHKNGDPVWIKGIYNPVLDVDNKPYKIVEFMSDITERKKLELQNIRHLKEIESSKKILEENNEELEAMHEIMIHKEKELSSNLAAIDSTISAIEFKMSGKVLKANQLFLNLMGYTQEEVKDQHHRIFVDKEYAESKEYVDFWEKLRQGNSHSSEFKHIDKEGNEIWLRATYTPVKDAQGSLYKVKKLAMDVTQEKRLRQKNNNQLKAIDRSTAVAEFDLRGYVLYANDLFLDMMGYTQEELKGKHHRLLVESEYSETTECENFWPTLANGQFIEGEFWRIDKNGESVWVKGSYNPVLDLNGKPYKVVKYVYDITFQKKLESELKDQILKLNDYKFALDSAAIVAITDVKGVITYVNDKFCDKSKYSRQELIGNTHAILNSGYHTKEFIAHLWDTIKKGNVWRSEIKNKAKNGEFYWVDTTIIPFLDSNGKPTMYLAIRFDITNRKKLEEELKKRGYELEQERNRVKVINKELATQNELIANKNKSITDSIEYALRIQEAILPLKSNIKADLPQSFILYKPRDIVSGDFYWFAKVSVPDENHPQTMVEKIIIAAIDCTGHGVPGALMSMIGNQLMDEIVVGKKVTSPEKILNLLNQNVRLILKQDELDNQDGMDMNLCVIDKANRVLEFAGAKNSMIYIHNGELKDIKADRSSIGGFQRPDFTTFTKQTIPLVAEDEQIFYLFSDGFQDQMGGPHERKFMRNNLRDLLFSIHQRPLDEQQQTLDEVFNDWLGSIEQLDDVLVIGFRVAN